MQVLAPDIRQTEAGAPGMVAALQHMNETVLKQTPMGRASLRP